LALQIPLWFAQQERILELGCGTAVVSIACHRLGAPYVLATDGNPDVVRLAAQNIETNQQPMPISRKSSDDAKSDTSPKMSSIEAKPLQWGLLNAMDYSEAADLVLGSDLTYNSGTWRVLAESMQAVLSPTGTILYLSLGHEGFNVNAEVEGFLSVAKEMGLVPVSEIGVEAGEKYIPVSSLVSSTISSQEEFKQLQDSGGAKIIALQRKQMRRNS
jgi:SAM-dependent methyltransferase